VGTQGPTTIPFPLSSFPGANPQEAAGRIINCYAEPLGDPSQSGVGAPKDAIVWRRAPGLTQHAMTAQAGYRGGLIVNNLSLEVFNNTLVTVDVSGTVVVLGALPGTKKVTIARNQNTNLAYPDVLIVDQDNGAFSVVLPGGAPVALNTSGAVPQAFSVSFQDGYFFLTIADGRVFASPINSIVPASWNALTFVTIQAKSDVLLFRGIAYQGYMFFFTSGSCEVWSDAALPAPQFAYTRSAVLTTGLIQPSAIAGFETGFDNLFWVAQDFGVWNMPPNSLQPVKVSPPDLDRLIESTVRSGDTLEAGVHIFAGKKFWTVQSSTWSWQFNVGTQKWNERSSLLLSTGLQSRWRGVGGHPAFGKWLGGDTQSGAIVYIDDTNYNDVTTQALGTFTTTWAPMMMRMESGAVDKFPYRARVARADFHYVRGTGVAGVTTPVQAVLSAANSGLGLVRLTVAKTLGFQDGNQVVVAGVAGTTEANGTWVINVVDATHIDLLASAFVHAYVSGGTITNVTPAPADIVDPAVAISWSDDGGQNWLGPVLRSLGPQSIIKTGRVSVKNTGLTGVQGRRWRMDISAAVYTAFLKATQSDDPTEIS
jgi:hypothetical protein